MSGRDPEHYVLDYERRKHAVSGPLSLAIELMLAGARPHGLDELLGHQAPEVSGSVARKVSEQENESRT